MNRHLSDPIQFRMYQTSTFLTIALLTTPQHPSKSLTILNHYATRGHPQNDIRQPTLLARYFPRKRRHALDCVIPFPRGQFRRPQGGGEAQGCSREGQGVRVNDQGNGGETKTDRRGCDTTAKFLSSSRCWAHVFRPLRSFGADEDYGSWSR